MGSRPDLDFNLKDLTRARTLAMGLAEFSSRAGHDLLGPLNQASSLLALFVQRNFVQRDFVQRNDSQPNDSQRGDSQGNDSQGNDSQGNDSQGNDSQGNNSQGNDTGADSEARILLEFLQTSAARLRGVVGGVQPYLNVAAAAPEFEAVDMNTARASAELRLERAIAESSAVIAPEPLPAISAVGDQMTLLFEILIANSIRFRRQSEAPRIRICAGKSAGNWLFRVEDNGIGIDAQYREIVFLPFRRLHGKEYAGAGMGLATAKLIVGLHGGDIWIEPAESDAPFGTAVLFTVPASA